MIAILLDIIRVDKTQRLIDEGLITNLNDTKKYWSSRVNIISQM